MIVYNLIIFLIWACDQLSQMMDAARGMALRKFGEVLSYLVAIALYCLSLAKNSPIVIFDEATSALDYYTEKQIQKGIKNLAKSKTTIIIAHRLSTIVHANKIIYLEDGIIKEQGSHEELMNSKGLYYNLWIIQQSNIN